MNLDEIIIIRVRDKTGDYRKEIFKVQDTTGKDLGHVFQDEDEDGWYAAVTEGPEMERVQSETPGQAFGDLLDRLFDMELG